MPHRIVNNEAERSALLTFLSKLPTPFTAEWVNGRDRTRGQNALQWLWATEAAMQLGDRTADEMQREWKLRHGVPILREDSASFREVYDSVIRPRSYPEKIEVMRFIEVTRVMKVRQMVRYLDAVQRECLENGLVLTEPDPELSSYHARYRRKQAA